MTNVLLTSQLNSGNPLIDSLYLHLKKYINIDIGIDIFWQKTKRTYNIIHIQWPEELLYWEDTTEDDLNRLIVQLNYWKLKGSKFVVTRHNVLPHKAQGVYPKIYETLYKYSNTVIHFSQSSIKDFNKRYKNLNHIKNSIIFHPLYDNIKNNCTKKEARKLLGIKNDKNVILIFGSIRHEKERKFAMDVFNALDINNKLLLAPRINQLVPSKYKFFKRLKFEIHKILSKLNKKLILDDVFIPESKIQVYMNASDIVFIPRFEVLNSGVLVLAYSFNKIVVGPSTGSIGEILDISENPSFKIGNIKDAVKQIKKGFNLSKKTVNNLKFAKDTMNWDITVKKHLAIYEELI